MLRNTGAVLYQLSYQANWWLVTLWVIPATHECDDLQCLNSTISISSTWLSSKLSSSVHSISGWPCLEQCNECSRFPPHLVNFVIQLKNFLWGVSFAVVSTFLWSWKKSLIYYQSSLATEFLSNEKQMFFERRTWSHNTLKVPSLLCKYNMNVVVGLLLLALAFSFLKLVRTECLLTG